MYLREEEKAKHNEATKLFIAKMAMLVMIKLREKDEVKDTLLPIPKGLDEINEQNKLLITIINNIIRNELKLDDLEGKEIRFKETSYLNEVDAVKLINSSIDNSEISGVLADKLLFDIDFIKNTVVVAIKELSKNVNIAKVKYESGRNTNTFSLVPVSIPAIIKYFSSRGDFKDLENNPVQFPIGTGNPSEYLNFDEVTEQDFRNQLLSHYDFNKNEVYDFLSGINEGELISTVRNYLTVISDRNDNLKYLSANTTVNHSKLYLVYLVSSMLLETTYADNKNLKLVNNGLKVLIARATKLTNDYINKKILVSYVDKDKIYVVEDLFVNNELDTAAIVGGVISANVKNNVGPVILDVDTVVRNTEAFKAAYNKSRIAKDVEIETGMKQAMINIYAIESKNLIETLTENVSISKLGILSAVTKYISDLDFKNTVDIEKVSQAIVLNHIYTSEVAKKFIEYFGMYATMNGSLTSQDCSLLAGASIVVIELGSNIVID